MPALKAKVTEMMDLHPEVGWSRAVATVADAGRVWAKSGSTRGLSNLEAIVWASEPDHVVSSRWGIWRTYRCIQGRTERPMTCSRAAWGG